MTLTPAQWMGVREGMLTPDQEEQVKGIRQYQEAKQWADAVDGLRNALGDALSSLPPMRWLLNAPPRTQKIIFACGFVAFGALVVAGVVLGVMQ